MPINIKCNLPTSLGAKLAQEVQATSGRGARLKDPEMQATLERSIVRDQDLLPHKVKSWIQGVAEKFNFAEKSVRSLKEIGDAAGENDLRLAYKQFITRDRNAMNTAATVVRDVFSAIHDSPADGFVKMRESYQLLFVKSNLERAKRGLKTVGGKDASYWAGEYEHLRKTSTREAQETERKVFATMREIGLDLEKNGQLPVGTVAKNGDYVPHDVLDFLEKDISATQGKQYRLKIAGHAKQAHGSEREIYGDFHTVIMHYVNSMEKAKASAEFVGKLVSRFGDAKMAETVQRTLPDGKVVETVVGVKDPSKYALWRYNNTNWGIQRLQQAMGLANKNEFINSAKELAPGLRDDQLEAIWQNTLSTLEGKGKTVVLPKGLVDDLFEWETGKYDTGVGATLRDLNAFWRRQMTGRIGLYTGIFSGRNTRGDWQQSLRDEPKALSIANDVANRLFSTQKGAMKHIVQWQTKLLNQSSAATRSLIGGKVPTYTDDEFATIMAEANRNGVTVGKFLGEAVTPEYTAKNATRELYAKMSGSSGLQAVEKGLSKIDEVDHMIKMQDATYRLSKYIVDRLPKEKGGNGLNEADAVRRNGDTFVDYQLLTPFEQKWLRDAFFPFYTFRKGNMVAWTKKLVGKDVPPEQRAQAWATFLAFSAIPVLWNHFQDPEGEERLQNDPRNKYIANTFHLFMGRNEAGEALYLTDPMPSSDIDRLINLQQMVNIGKKTLSGDRPISQTPELVAKQLLTTLIDGTMGMIRDDASPLLKAPFEVANNQSFFYKIPIRKTDAPSYVQAAQLGNYALKTFDRQFSTAQGLFFNKAGAGVDTLRLMGTPINVHSAGLSKSNAEEVEGEIFGGVIRPQVPKKEAFIDQYERVMKDKLTDYEKEVLLQHYPTIKEIMAQQYSQIVEGRIRQRQDLIKKALVANGFSPDYSILFKLPDAERDAITAKVKAQKWYRDLTSFGDKDRRRIYQQTMQEAGLR